MPHGESSQVTPSNGNFVKILSKNINSTTDTYSNCFAQGYHGLAEYRQQTKTNPIHVYDQLLISIFSPELLPNNKQQYLY